jgi:GTPase SAR1 family protein
MLPPELLASTDAQAILAAYRRYREAEQRNTLRPLNEAKLVVVGNEAVGKTSLIRYLVHDRPRDPDERKTPGTAIHEKIEVSSWSPHQSQVRLNVWDFGGQEIMRGTHRFFLTERSLYLLVLEDRREDDRSIYEWLELIAQRGGDSPVIIVINKSDHDVPQRQLDEAALRRAYPAIAGFARTSCNAGATAAQSIAGLRVQIATTLSESERLKHIRDPIPPSWLRVKEAIAEQARARSVLPLRDFERLCEHAAPGAERVLDPNEQRALLGLLNDLGVVVGHGLRHDAPAARREITVLDPNWLTGAIYALINSPTVRDQGGELHHQQLTELLDPAKYPARWHELILSMMQEPALGLCFAIPHASPTRYLLPDALPVKEPDYGIWPADALRFRYQYTLLPTGFLPRFIVEAHRNLTANPTWWRTGVVLGAEGCRVLVRGDIARNTVEILVAGTTGQRAALSIVRNHFAAVHGHYAGLTVKERVPLPEQPEVDVGYQHLLTLEGEEGIEHAFRPDGADRKYSVRELLEGVRDVGARRHRRRADEDNSSLDSKDPWPRPPMKHKILFLAANPLGTDRLALDREARDIQVELEHSGFRDRFELVTRWAVQPLDLLRELRKLRPTVVHFSGHGGEESVGASRPGAALHRDVVGPATPPRAPHQGLFFQGPDGLRQLVSTQALEQTFGAAGSSVQLVVLNACYSEAQAQALLPHVGCVVGMHGSILDAAARSFAIGFYGGLGEHESIDAAFKQGRAAISLNGLDHHDRPQLAVRADLDARKLILAANPQ